MIPRQEPLADPAVLFASGGARGHVAEDRVDSYLLALRLGATGIETGVTTTADGHPVLRTDARLGGLRRRTIGQVERSALPDDVVTLEAYYEQVGTDADLLLHVHTAAAVEPTIALAARFQALDRLWLAAADVALLASWRERSELIRLVDTTPVAEMAAGMERHAAGLRAARIDALMLPHTDWKGGRTALLHRFGRRCVAGGAQHERSIRMALHIGADAVSSSFPDRLADAARAVAAPDAPLLLDD